MKRVTFFLVLGVVSLGQFGESPLSAQQVSQIFIVDRGNNRIVMINGMTWSGWAAFGGTAVGSSRFRVPRGIFVDAAGRIYITDRDNGLVRIKSMAGEDWMAAGTPGSAGLQFANPSGVFIDRVGRVYVVDTGNHRIVRMDALSGHGLTTLGTRGSQAGQFSDPVGIFLDNGGRIYMPFGIFVTADQKIYVADNANHRIVRVDDMDGSGWISLGGNPSSGANQFSFPSGIFVR